MSDNIFYSLEEFETAKNYWIEKFSGEINEMILKSDFTRNSKYSKSEYKVIIDTEVSEFLLKTSKNNDLLTFVILLAGLKVLLYKYTDLRDITVGSPVLIDLETKNQEELQSIYSINKFVALRDLLNDEMTFKELLVKIKQTVFEGYDNQHYSIKELYKNIKFDDTIKSLLRGILMFNTIHGSSLLDEIESCGNDFTFYISKIDDSRLDCKIIYNSELFNDFSISTFCECYFNILNQVMSNINVKLADIELINKKDYNELFNLNKVNDQYTTTQLITQLFEDQVLKTPNNTAISVYYDFKHLLDELVNHMPSAHIYNKLKNTCFKINPYICKLDDELLMEAALTIEGYDKSSLSMIKTHCFNYIIINQNLVELLQYFSGENNLDSIYNKIKHSNLNYLILNAKSTEHSWELQFEKTEIDLDNNHESFMSLIRGMYISNLIELDSINKASLLEIKSSQLFYKKQITKCYGDKTKVDTNSKSILLLGSTPGTATVGLLYLASYLRRNGIDAYCQFNDLNVTYSSLKDNIHKLLIQTNPQIVGISIKWFIHIARGIEICKIIKEFSKDIEIVIGGNTASLFNQNFINYEYIDYVVCGDGEIPLLKICKGEENIPNCVYKRNGKVVKSSITYIQDTHTNDIYLSHLNEIFVSKQFLFCIPYIYIYTGKGCSMNCFYCGGCLDAQVKEFDRKKPFVREISDVRKDLIEAKKYTSTFMFVDSFNFDTLNYHKKLWEEIDLANHFCSFYFYKLPGREFIELITQTFKYVYINIDLCTLSERHRQYLHSMNLIKPMPTDKEVLEFIELCDNYKNIEVGISLISGLPYYTIEDMEKSKEILNILVRYSSFKGLEWGRLHAQPGASIINDSNLHGMYSQASSFEEFLRFSKLNMDQQPYYPDIYSYNFPYIYFNNEILNSEVGKHYGEINSLLMNKSKFGKSKTHCFENITYNELNQRADNLANILIKNGIKQDDIVGLMVDQSIDLAVGILGILKSGGAYLPIDPEYPDNRIKYILENSNTKILLTQTELLNRISFEPIIQINNERIIKENTISCCNLAKPSSLAYVVYTSGSTGNPKGVMIEHKSLSNFIYWRTKKYSFKTNDNTLQTISISFDGFGTNFYSSLISGGTLFLLNGNARKDIICIRKVIHKKKITNMSLVPSMYRAIIQDAHKSDIKSLRFVVLAAEKADSGLIKLSQSLNPAMDIINEYGPTENTITTTAYIGMNCDNTSIIGKPISNTSIYILNKCNNLLPIGVFGEICISGEGVSRGYINDEILTSNRFTQNPFELGKRMYRTGDIGRWLPNGNLELMGRSDHQIKIRGFRIELGEIENCLLKVEFINEAIVNAVEDINQNKTLCAYFTSNQKLNIESIKDYLIQQLPEYMVPTYIIQLEKFYLTINGKIDRSNLPSPISTCNKENEIHLPTNEIELKLIKIWENVLNFQNININDNFFDLGGNSILLMQIHSQIEMLITNEITITDLFSYPTISKLAEFIYSKGSKPCINVTIKEIDLPEEFFTIGDKNESSPILKFNIGKQLTEKIRQIAVAEDIETYNILVAMYLYLYSEISNSKIVTVYATNKRKNEIIPISLNLTEVDNFSIMFKKIRQQINETNKVEVIRLEDLSMSIKVKKGYTVIPLILNKDQVTLDINLSDICDISFILNQERENVSIICEYNGKRLKKEMVEELISGYIELIELLVNKYRINDDCEDCLNCQCEQ